MYSNDSRNGFSIVDILVKIIFAGLFIFILIWLFNKNVPNMKPFYSNVFRENIKYMQEAGESYFTDDKMPKNIGDTVKITLGEMFDRKLILPFVDEDGNSCNQYDSYVSVTKTANNYELKTNLVCNKETNYTVKILGCHTYCENGECNKNACTVETITKYQYKKLVSGTKTTYSCPKGYTLKNKKCTKTELTSTKDAKKTTDQNIIDATIKYEEGTTTRLDTLKGNTKVYVSRIETTSSSTTKSKQVAYSCTKTEKQCSTTTKTEKKCTTTNVSESYSCNCTSSIGSTGKTVTKCSTCYRTVPKETCTNVSTPYETCNNVNVNSTCYRTEYETVPGATTYKCPSYAYSTGSGSNLKCYVYDTDYYCPSKANYSTGSGSNLKCYYKTSGQTYYSCPKGYTQVKAKCVGTSSSHYTCDGYTGYKLEGTKCNKYETKTINATKNTKNTSSYKYTWSTKSSLSGWTKTGKTKTENKEICK